MHNNISAYIADYKTDISRTRHCLQSLYQHLRYHTNTLRLGSTPEEMELANPVGTSPANIIYSSVGTCAA